MRTPENLRILIVSAVFLTSVLISACDRGNEAQAQQPTPTHTPTPGVTVVEPTATPRIVVVQSGVNNEGRAENKVIARKVITEENSSKENSSQLTYMAERVYYEGELPLTQEEIGIFTNSVVNLQALLNTANIDRMELNIKESDTYFYLDQGSNLIPTNSQSQVTIKAIVDKETGNIKLVGILKPIDSNTQTDITSAIISPDYTTVTFVSNKLTFQASLTPNSNVWKLSQIQ